MEKITKEELSNVLQLTDEEFDRILGGVHVNWCINKCADVVPVGLTVCDRSSSNRNAETACREKVMREFEMCKSNCL